VTAACTGRTDATGAGDIEGVSVCDASPRRDAGDSACDASGSGGCSDAEDPIGSQAFHFCASAWIRSLKRSRPTAAMILAMRSWSLGSKHVARRTSKLRSPASTASAPAPRATDGLLRAY